MKRNISKYLERWKNDSERQVLLLRGARQIGKTWSLRNLGRQFTYVLEVNFEEEPAVRRFFETSRNPSTLLAQLSAYYDVPVEAGKTLVILDEIQSCPNALSSLRFFYEKIPGLHVAAAGSLLEFALAELPSHGVGRIESLFMYPMNFAEFVAAEAGDGLAEMLGAADPNNPLDTVFHDKLIELMRTYQIVGGLPDVVKTYVMHHDYARCIDRLDSLITTFRDDFAKYRNRSPVARLSDVFESVSLQAGSKFKYSTASDGCGSREIKSALEMILCAGLAYRVRHSSGQGIPLGAQVKPKRFKVLPFDIGIHQRVLGLDIPSHLVAPPGDLAHRGSLAEVFLGLELIASRNPARHPQLYYWHREAASSNAEVDYLIQRNTDVVPLEIKAGRRGQMQSMYQFLDSHPQSTYGIRLSIENFSSYGRVRVMPLYRAAYL